MAKVICAEPECEFYNKDGCTAEEVNLTAGRVHTMHQGYMRVWECRMFKQSEEARALFEMLKRYFDACYRKKTDG